MSEVGSRQAAANVRIWVVAVKLPDRRRPSGRRSMYDCELDSDPRRHLLGSYNNSVESQPCSSHSYYKSRRRPFQR